MADDHGIDLDELARRLRDQVEIKDRRYRLKTYERCFVGGDAVDWLIESGIAADVDQAVALGNALLDEGVIHHVVRDHRFKNEELYYRFAADEDHGEVATRAAGTAVSWLEVLGRGWAAGDGDDGDGDVGESRLARIPTYEEELGEMIAVSELGVEPLDEHNARLLDNVHPRSWSDPTPSGRYNLVVIGAGTGGLVTAAACAGLGGKVALIESHLLGGDCLNVGCVPSKALLRCARAAAAVRAAADYGVVVRGEIEIDFAAVMERLRRLRAEIAPHDSAERFAGLGVDVFVGRARFTGPDRVEVNGQNLEFARAVIATGGSPAVPAIDGIDEVPFLTNASVFNLTRRPPRLGIIGAGVIGVEMAQAFQRLGSRVTVLERGERILPREDADAAAIVCAALERDGVELRFGFEAARVSHRDGGGDWPVITVDSSGGAVEVDSLLIATGRVPNVAGLGLDAAGVDHDESRGVHVDDQLRTSNRSIFAVGDVCTRYQFTHAADFMARLAVRNALFFGRGRFSRLVIPWCTYTEPELAHVGLYPRDLSERGIEHATFERRFAEVDRAIVDGATEGFVRVHVKQGTDEILGATIVGDRAGDLISEITLAMRHGVGLGALADVIHPCPTRAEAVRQCGDAYNRTRLTTAVKSLFRGLLALRR
jgi:pyruvate/2-oxoglutarate dehydrogenase complex dihydrolipoamide dehydrogenase (E3) component